MKLFMTVMTPTFSSHSVSELSHLHREIHKQELSCLKVIFIFHVSYYASQNHRNLAACGAVTPISVAQKGQRLQGFIVVSTIDNTLVSACSFMTIVITGNSKYIIKPKKIKHALKSMKSLVRFVMVCLKARSTHVYALNFNWYK